MTLGVVCCRRSKIEEIAANQTSQLKGLAFLMSGSLQSASSLQATTQASQLPTHPESAITANVSFWCWPALSTVDLLSVSPCNTCTGRDKLAYNMLHKHAILMLASWTHIQPYTKHVGMRCHKQVAVRWWCYAGVRHFVSCRMVLYMVLRIRETTLLVQLSRTTHWAPQHQCTTIQRHTLSVGVSCSHQTWAAA